jgi:hypothetical protein
VNENFFRVVGIHIFKHTTASALAGQTDIFSVVTKIEVATLDLGG